MSPVTNARLVFNEIPTGYPIPGKTTIHDTTQTIDPETVPLNGGFLLKTLAVSIDPYMRGRMREPDIVSYAPAFPIGEAINGYAVGVVLRSEHPDYPKGSHVYGFYNYQQYVVVEKASLTGGLAAYKVLPEDSKLPWSVFLGAAGMAGQTAYVGWKEYAKAKKGDTVFVTAGSGPVGMMVIQLAKAEGLKVISSAGSPEKVKLLENLGVDVAFNYKTTSTLEVLKKEGPIDIFWDSVGGESLEAVLETATTGATVIECGYISSYNGTSYHVKNLSEIFAKEVKIFGFLVLSLLPKYVDEFYREVPKKLASGELKYLEDRTIGLENAGQALMENQQGKNMGKSVVIVADE